MDAYIDLVGKSVKEFYPPTTPDIDFWSWNVVVCESLYGKLLYTITPPHGYTYEMDVGRQYTEDMCKRIRLSPEDTLMWVLKYGETLPLFYSELVHE